MAKHLHDETAIKNTETLAHCQTCANLWKSHCELKMLIIALEVVSSSCNSISEVKNQVVNMRVFGITADPQNCRPQVKLWCPKLWHTRWYECNSLGLLSCQCRNESSGVPQLLRFFCAGQKVHIFSIWDQHFGHLGTSWGQISRTPTFMRTAENEGRWGDGGWLQIPLWGGGWNANHAICIICLLCGNNEHQSVKPWVSCCIWKI